ncbi:MAG: hypothetical protein AAF849_14945 [Bacteroidota bacterium]
MEEKEIIILYPDFLEDEEIYDQLEASWNEAIMALGEEHEISLAPYINQFDAEGNKYREANPIISALEQSANRGVRIIQYTVEEAQELFISAFFNELPLDEDNPIQEMVIDLVLSEETKLKALEWIKLWLIDQIEQEEMDEIIEEEMELAEEAA